MDMLLVVVTALSLAMVIAMGTMVWRMAREDRRRSDARVAALLELTQSRGELTQSRAGVPRAAVPRANVPQSDVASEHVAPSTSHVARRMSHVGGVRSHSARGTSAGDCLSSPIADLELRRPGTGVAGVAELFAEPERSSPWASRLLIVAALVLIVSGAGYVLMRPATTATAGAGATGTPGGATAAPLELLSLEHAQSAEALTVSGLVQNPRSAALVERVAVTALAFGADGALLASGRAPLDYTTLAPGDESPFVVTVPVRGRVARYRIGFRSEDGSVIAHLDKRQADAVAMK